MSAFSELDDVIMSSTHMSSYSFVINLSNSIIGVSVLAFPFCFKECGLILGLLLVLGSAWLTVVTCHLLMKTALTTKKRSYQYLALHIFGVAGKFTVEVSIIGMLIGTCIAFYIIIGDIGPAIVSKMAGIENTPNLRTVILIVATVFGSLPLGMLESLDRLSRFSAISLTFYAIFAIHVFVSAFANFWSGVWISKIVYWNLDGLFKCIPIFAVSFACQTQLFIMYEALHEPSLKQMDSIVKNAVGLCAIVYLLVGCFGYIAFYDHEISGDVLMNFHPTLFNEVIKLCFVLSTVISFPLVIFPCRASIYTLLFTQRVNIHRNISSSVYIPEMHFKLITVGIVVFSLCIGIIVPNVEFVLSVTGATMGSLICFILPAVMTMTVSSIGQGKHRFRAQFVLFVGVTILLASTYVTISTQEMLVQQESIVKLAQPITHLDSDDVKQAELDLLLNEGGINEELKMNMSVTVKPANMSLTPKSAAVGQLVEDVEEDQRQEPPNPREPLEADKDLVDDQKPETKLLKKPDKAADITSSTKLPVVHEVATENKEDDAKGILVALRKQQEENKRMLSEQRQIIDELRRHELEAHHLVDHSTKMANKIDARAADQHEEAPKKKLVQPTAGKPAQDTTAKSIQLAVDRHLMENKSDTEQNRHEHNRTERAHGT